MSILAPFDISSLILLIFELFSVSIIAGYFKQKSKNSQQNSIKTNINEFIWHLTTALINSPEISTKRGVWRLVGLNWLIGIFLLQQIFAGDMYTSMALVPDLGTIDNFDDLALKSIGPINVFVSKKSDVDNYISSETKYKKDLTKRLKPMPLEGLLNLNIIEKLLINVSSGKKYHIGSRDLLDFYQKTLFNGRFRESLYISKEFGQTVPLFIILGSKIEKRIFGTFNKM